MNIGNKLAMILIALSLGVIAMLSGLFYVQFDKALKERVLLQLSSVKQLKIVKIKNELNERIKIFHSLEPGELTEAESDLFFFVRNFPDLPDTVSGYPIDLEEGKFPERLTLVDLTLYHPEERVTIGFVSKKQDGQYKIALADIPEVQEILLERTGLGQTGESYLVGDKFRLRTKSRFYTGKPSETKVKTEGVIWALAGDPGEGLFPDYRGVEVFSSYERINLNGLSWVLLSEMDHQEALFPLRKLRTNLIYMLIVILLIILVVSYFLSRMIVSPVVSMEKKLIAMSRGILDGVSSSRDRQDEIGRMFEALNRLVHALNATILFAGKIGSGDFEAEFQQLSPEDKLGHALLQMKDKLREFQETEQRLIKKNQQSILDGEEKERARLSKEMHDGLGPLLTTLRLNIQVATLEESTKRLFLERLDDTITEVRRMSNNLMPSVLSDFGVGEAIGNFINQVKGNVPITIRYKNDMPADSKVSDAVHVNLYRIAQESIHNAIKHANATEIKVSITEFEDYVGYFISDNGQGFDSSQSYSGNGLRNMRERVKLANGSIEIKSSPKGTTIELEIPIK